MLFNSYAFIFGFVPLTYAGFFLIGRLRHARARPMALGFLALASLVFYAWWNPRDLLVILPSMAFNLAVGRQLSRGGSRRWLFLGVAVDLVALAYFKYSGFLLQQFTDSTFNPGPLPLGISFFTFVQIAFLVDSARGETSLYSRIEYLLFVTYFPHLIAGPIIHHREVIPRFREPGFLRADPTRIAVGLTVFTLGLAKKVLIADSIAPYADLVFQPSHAVIAGFWEAWAGTLAYTLQIYFDFSGYSEMALGLSYALGVPLPANFNSPYQAASIGEFWRRWHISLSHFLRDYLYIPLGGNRAGPARRYVNLFVTMVLGGLWHGAGWTFVLWGALHGGFLVINHSWTQFRQRRGGRGLPTVLAHGLTLLCVMLAWVPFRATTWDSAMNIYAGLFGAHGITWRSGEGIFPHFPDLRGMVPLMLAAFAAVAVFMPNVLRVFARERIALRVNVEPPSGPLAPLAWRPSLPWAAVTAVLLVASLVAMNRESVFLYFQF